MTNAELLANFVRFQLSYDDLMVQFWLNNRESDMRAALAALKSSLPHELLRLIDAAMQTAPSRIDSISRRRWGKEDLKDFPLAYGYWAFVKGYQYLLDLPSDPVYICHWLREDACLQGLNISYVREDSRFKRLFPWGILLNELVRYPSVAEPGEEIYNVLRRLRLYTRDNLHQLRPFSSESRGGLDSLRQATTDFLVDALKDAMPLEWEKHIQIKPIVNRLLIGPVVASRN
ncbi:MAG TPA: hypothetical protein VN924_08515 [Bryobacteraceae bacterium]|nr:hypothetical protein [Bryobacteraceae bacterium]